MRCWVVEVRNVRRVPAVFARQLLSGNASEGRDGAWQLSHPVTGPWPPAMAGGSR
jgi:hypothetical protein